MRAEREWTPGILSEAVGEGNDCVEDLAFEADALESLETGMLEFSRCRFRAVSFNACDIGRVYFADCRFERCDFSGFRFREGTLARTQFDGCRGVGATFDHMILREVSSMAVNLPLG